MISFKSWSDYRSDWVTPERLLLLIPLIIGSGIAGLMAIILYLPLLYQVNVLGKLVQGQQDKVALLPTYRQQLNVQLQRLEGARSQEELLLRLVAGTGQLQTLQAELSLLARRSGVVISGFEPRLADSAAALDQSKTGAPAGSPAGSSSPASGGASPQPAGAALAADPLLVAGLQKKSVLLTVKGRFPNLRGFLDAVENLNVIAISTDLKLNTTDDGATPLVPQAPSLAQTTMTLVLSTYDRPGQRPAQATTPATSPATSPATTPAPAP